MPLRDVQMAIRDALVLGDICGLESMLAGGAAASKRLAIHQRHYRVSLVTALLDRFPATVWLVGSAFVTEAAQRFVRHHPPTRPCIVEYGEEFPAFLAAQPGAAAMPYLRQFIELEWHVSRLSLAVDMPALPMASLSTVDATTLADARLALQPGVHYFHADWALDELMSLHLADNAPDQFPLHPGDVWLELRGARGELRMNRLGHAPFAFRAALAASETLGNAAVSALEIDEAFDAGQGLLSLFGDKLIVRIDTLHVEGAA